MAYFVKEAFKTLQGEGVNAGRTAVFCRFAGCNLWSGREADRAEAACAFCDTDFVGVDGEGGGRFVDAPALVAHLLGLWGPGETARLVVLTGGEPMLQVDDALIAALSSGKLAAAGLDVFRGEPRIDPRYRDLDNVFLLPHIGSATPGTRSAMGHKCIDNLEQFFRGEKPTDLLTGD